MPDPFHLLEETVTADVTKSEDVKAYVKAAIEKFVHSYGYREGYPICALRPTGVYGLAHPAEDSKWFKIVQSVVRGETVTCDRGGKEVHRGPESIVCIQKGCAWVGHPPQ